MWPDARRPEDCRAADVEIVRSKLEARAKRATIAEL